MFIIGHRGARGEAPENTLAGFRYLVELPILHVELDIRRSKDGRLVVVHDSTVNRTVQAKGSVSDYSFTELAAFPGKHTFQKVFELSTGIPDLQSVIDACPEMLSYQFEVKADDEVEAYGLAEAVVDFIHANKLWDKVIITSINRNVLKRVNEITQGQSIKMGYVSDDAWPVPLQVANDLNASHLILYYKKANNKTIAEAKKAGKEVSVWTVNQWADFKALMTAGVDSIITDYPREMITHLQEAD